MSRSLVERDARYVADAIKLRYTPFVAARGEGAYLYDESDRRFVDFGAGWAAAGLGYSNDRVKQAVAVQMDKATMSGLLSSINEPAVDLAERLVALVPGNIEKKTWFGLAGSDAAEAAQRMILRDRQTAHRVVRWWLARHARRGHGIERPPVPRRDARRRACDQDPLPESLS
jgi:4-aminobutyrate aminotransferase-like enzyme